MLKEKVMKNKFKWIKVFIMLAVTGLLLNGCNYGEDPVGTSSNTQYQSFDPIPGHTYYDLIAGQNIDVGYVDVWNDLTNLYVDYVIEAPGWCLTETHMYAATTLGGIPQTKKGNPIPGQFDYKHEDLNCASSDSYVIPLTEIDPGWNCDDELFVATHAVVQNQSEECIDFEAYTVEFTEISNQEEDFSFFMADATPLENNFNPTTPAFELNIGQVINVTPTGEYPIIGIPKTGWNGLIAGFSNGYNDDFVNPYFTGAGGNNLTDAQDKSYANPIEWHRHNKTQAITFELENAAPNVSLYMLDPDGLEVFVAVALNENNEIVDYISFTKVSQNITRDGAAVLVELSANENYGLIKKVMAYAARKLVNQIDFVGYAIDNVCATFIESETAWGNGPNFPGNNWAMYFNYTITCEDPPPPSGCETAFGYYNQTKSTCFLDLNLGFHRWGWTNGPLSNGLYTFDIYAGAGQCDLGKGTLVGTLTVAYEGSSATVTYSMNTGYTMEETHLYVGNEILPKKNGEFTVAPGQYPYIHENLNGASTDTYTITGLGGDIYVVAHAVVCGFE